MNPLKYYDRQKESWNDTEIDDLKKEYEIQNLTISQIGDIHRRTPGCISYKLKNLNLITHNKLARGYAEYRNSALYNEIISIGKVKDEERKNKQSSYKDDLIILKKDIDTIKKDVQEILRLINAIYDFET